MKLNLPQNEDLSIIELLLTQDKDNIELAKQLFAGLYPDMSELEFLTKYHYDMATYIKFDEFLYRKWIINIDTFEQLYYIQHLKINTYILNINYKNTKEFIKFKIPDNVEYCYISESNLDLDFNNIERIQFRGSNYNYNELPISLKGLQIINCEKMTKLPKLPPNLENLIYSPVPNFSSITSLPQTLPKTLIELVFVKTNIQILNQELPNLKWLRVMDNKLKELPKELPECEEIVCRNNNLKTLPKFSNKLKVLDCSNNPILPSEIERIKKEHPNIQFTY